MSKQHELLKDYVVTAKPVVHMPSYLIHDDESTIISGYKTAYEKGVTYHYADGDIEHCDVSFTKRAELQWYTEVPISTVKMYFRKWNEANTLKPYAVAGSCGWYLFAKGETKGIFVAYETFVFQRAILSRQGVENGYRTDQQCDYDTVVGKIKAGLGDRAWSSAFSSAMKEA